MDNFLVTYYVLLFLSYTQFAISIRTGSVLPINICRSAKSLKNDIHQWKELCIEEPFDLTNTARSVYDFETFERVKAVFVASWHVLQDTLNLDSVFSPLVISPTSSHFISYNSSSELDSTVTTQTSTGIGAESDDVAVIDDGDIAADADDANNKTMIVTNLNDNSTNSTTAGLMKYDEQQFVCVKSMLKELTLADSSSADVADNSVSNVEFVNFAPKMKFKNLNRENKRFVNTSTTTLPATAQLDASNRCLVAATAKYNEKSLVKLNPKKEIKTTNATANLVCALTTSS